MAVVAVLDSDVLFPMVLRDTLLRIAAAGCFRAHWSERILEEVARNLIEQERMEPGQADMLVMAMTDAFPEAIVTGWKRHEKAMANHPKDRHVAAAAVDARASVIVTSNLKDFKNLPEGIVAMSPDAFLSAMFEAAPDAVLGALRKQAAGYRKPSATLASLLAWLARAAPTFAAAAAKTAGGS